MASASTTALRSTWSSPAVRWAVSGWAFFIVENAILSENRTYLIEMLGKEPYHAVYGTCSTIAMGSIGYAYKYKLPPVAKTTPRMSALALSWTCLTAGMVMASQSLPKLQIPVALQRTTQDSTSVVPSQVDQPSTPSQPSSWKLQVRCPFDFTDDKSTSVGADVRGLDRISRHPGLWSFAFLGAGMASLQLTLARQLWFLGPAAVAWLGGAHTDSRYRRGLGGSMDPAYESVTSNLPLAACLSGKQGSSALPKLFLEELKPLNALVAAGAATMFVASRGRRFR